MAQSFTVQLTFGSHRIENVNLQWGVGMGSDTRRDAPSWGTDIEVPAVIELLDLITAGVITAEQARDNLNRLTAAIKERMDREYEEMIELMEQPTPRAVREKIASMTSGCMPYRSTAPLAQSRSALRRT